MRHIPQSRVASSEFGWGSSHFNSGVPSAFSTVEYGSILHMDSGWLKIKAQYQRAATCLPGRLLELCVILREEVHLPTCTMRGAQSQIPPSIKIGILNPNHCNYLPCCFVNSWRHWHIVDCLDYLKIRKCFFKIVP